MIKEFDQLANFDLGKFAANLEEIKQMILTEVDKDERQDDDEIVLEVIRVIQEEIAKRTGKSKKRELADDVKFLAYINLFHKIMDEGFEEEDFDDEDEDEDEDEEYDEDLLEDAEDDK